MAAASLLSQAHSGGLPACHQCLLDACRLSWYVLESCWLLSQRASCLMHVTRMIVYCHLIEAWADDLPTVTGVHWQPAATHWHGLMTCGLLSARARHLPLVASACQRPAVCCWHVSMASCLLLAHVATCHLSLARAGNLLSLTGGCLWPSATRRYSPGACGLLPAWCSGLLPVAGVHRHPATCHQNVLMAWPLLP